MAPSRLLCCAVACDVRTPPALSTPKSPWFSFLSLSLGSSVSRSNRWQQCPVRRSGAGGWTHSPVPWATALPATASGWGGLLGSLELRPTGCGEPTHKDGLSHWPRVWLGGVHVRPGCPAQPLADGAPARSSVGTFLLTHPCALRRRVCGTWYLGPFPCRLRYLAF